MRTKKFLALFVFSIFLSFTVSATDYNRDRTRNHKRNHNHNNYYGGGNGNGTVGAPLDGGLLTVLGAAGVAYFTARKKKKNGEVL